MKRIVSPIVWLGLISILSLSLRASIVNAQESTPARVLAPLGTEFTYQGELQDTNGPVTALCDFQFKLWDAATAGTQVGSTQIVNNISVNSGLFSVLLNEDGQFGSSAFMGDARWLELAVRCPAGAGSFAALAPRQMVAATPYALYSQSSAWDGLIGIPADFADGTDDDTTYAAGTGLILNEGAFSVESVPWSTLDEVPAGFADGTDNDTIYSAGTGLILSGGAFQVQFAGTGSATSASRSDHNHGGQSWVGVGEFGLRIQNNTATAFTSGIIGAVTQSDNSAGIQGRHESPTGTGRGVFGVSESNSGIGTSGFAPSPTGNTVGVFGSVASSNGRGVSGYAASLTGDATGVLGGSESSTGRGVAGIAYATSGVNAGVYGATHSPQGWAGYFDGGVNVVGNVNVTGTLIKAAGSFRIDHPLDPENKYLSHSFVESPDMMNVYNGNVTLDANGEGWVDLPSYFEALNKDFRYQLTPIGAPGPNLYIAEPVSDNRFKIGGGTPALVVSWQVTGIRQDPYALANPIVVEEDKPAEELGAFLLSAGLAKSEGQETPHEQHMHSEMSQWYIQQQSASPAFQASSTVSNTWENQ